MTPNLAAWTTHFISSQFCRSESSELDWVLRMSQDQSQPGWNALWSLWRWIWFQAHSGCGCGSGATCWLSAGGCSLLLEGPHIHHMRPPSSSKPAIVYWIFPCFGSQTFSLLAVEKALCFKESLWLAEPARITVRLTVSQHNTIMRVTFPQIPSFHRFREEYFCAGHCRNSVTEDVGGKS